MSAVVIRRRINMQRNILKQRVIRLCKRIRKVSRGNGATLIRYISIKKILPAFGWEYFILRLSTISRYKELFVCRDRVVDSRVRGVGCLGGEAGFQSREECRVQNGGFQEESIDSFFDCALW